MNEQKGFDSTKQVVVIGGGPAGCATALALRSLGVASILVVEANWEKYFFFCNICFQRICISGLFFS